MAFSDKLQRRRKELGMTQGQLADKVGVSKRTIAGYEAGGRYPKDHSLYARLADALSCDQDYLLTDSERFVADAGNAYGYRGRKQAEEAVNTLSGMFAGGELSDEDRDAVLKAVQQAYWDSKEDNKKFTPFKFREEDDRDD
ncbi:MAG: helix-turn-helix transcriptional regulator [Eubacteriales bacterium]|nr:helix-turn-helix transcriptional regulator [Eubacteriales bacterium]